VPGVDVYAYMTHLPVQRWGRAWLERGTAECRKPIYDGDTAIVTELCVTGRAALPRNGSHHRPSSPKLRSRPPNARRPTRRRSQSAPASRSIRFA